MCRHVRGDIPPKNAGRYTHVIPVELRPDGVIEFRDASPMKQAIIVGLGGLIGSIARYQLGGLILHHSASWRFPLSTFVINVTGCFVIGALAALAEHRDSFSTEARLFLFTGVLGGFTTFSAFGYEGIYLLRRGEIAIALAYAGLSVICGFAAVWLGFRSLSFLSHR